MKIALEKLSVKELRELGERIDQAVKVRKVQELADVKQKLAQIAAEAGFSVEEVVGGGAKGRGRPGKVREVKYRNPKDAEQTWSGRGRKPNWLVKAGGNIERFRVG